MGGILVQCSESSGNLDVLAENLGTLDLRNRNKNRSGAAKRRAGKVRLAEASACDSADSQNQQGLLNRGLRPRAVRVAPRRSSALLGSRQNEVKYHRSTGLVKYGPLTPEGSRLLQSPGNRHRSSGGSPDTGQAKKPGRNRHLSYIKAGSEDDYQYMMATRTCKSQRRNSSTSILILEGLWMGSLRRGSSQVHLGLLR